MDLRELFSEDYSEERKKNKDIQNGDPEFDNEESRKSEEQYEKDPGEKENTLNEIQDETEKEGAYRTIVNFNENEAALTQDIGPDGEYMYHVMEAVDKYRAALNNEVWLPEHGMRLDRDAVDFVIENHGKNVLRACNEYEQNADPWTPRGHQRLNTVKALRHAIRQQQEMMVGDMCVYVTSDAAVKGGSVTFEQMIIESQSGDLQGRNRAEAIHLVERSGEKTGAADDEGARRRGRRTQKQEELQATDVEEKKDTQEKRNDSLKMRGNKLGYSFVVNFLGKEGAGLLPFNPNSMANAKSVTELEEITDFVPFDKLMGSNPADYNLQMSVNAQNQINTIKMLGLLIGVSDFANLANNRNLLFKAHKRGKMVYVDSVVLRDPIAASQSLSGNLTKPEFEALVDDIGIDGGGGEELIQRLDRLINSLNQDMNARDSNVIKRAQRLFAVLAVYLMTGRNADAIPDRYFL